MAEKTDWQGALGAKWASLAAIMERMLSPFGDEAMEALGPIEGRHSLDLGCGGGASSFALAHRGAASVIGVDVSPDLIALAARRRAAETGPARRVGFLCADAAEARFSHPMEALFSQFGAMFFAAPIPAYTHLRRAMAPGAPLAIACWRTPKENEWATLALGAAKSLLPPAPPADRRAPGPFGWSEPEESFAPILAAAGWRDVSWRPVDHSVALGAGMEGAPLDAATRFAMETGPLASRLRDLPASLKSRVEPLVREALAKRERAGRVEASAAGWIVTARA
ncbi:MAG: methyltransferase domain-containing protein [Paracoccaceae bacterium]